MIVATEVPSCASHTNALRDYAGIFLRGLFVVFLVATNTKQVTGDHFIGAAVVGYLISYLWFSNARVAGRTDLKYAREVYAAGASAGTILGMWITRAVYGV